MAKAELKTRETKASVEDFLNGVGDENARADCWKIVKLMSTATGSEPKMWGESIVGFGRRPLKYSSGRELDWPIIAFSPRKQNLTLYLAESARTEDLLSKLGKYKTSKACLYIKRLSDVDEEVLRKMIEKSV